MNLQEFRILMNAENTQSLRAPECLKDLTESEIQQKFIISANIKDLMLNFFCVDEQEFVSALKRVMASRYNLTGQGTAASPYHIDTPFGSGKFLNFYNFFTSRKLPQYLVKQECFSNCYEFAKKQNIHSTVLSGICHRQSSFLHSVLLINGYILDFNYDLAMSKQLYCELFNFEILNEVDSDEIKANAYLFNKKSKFVEQTELTYADVNFCYSDIIKELEKERGLSI